MPARRPRIGVSSNLFHADPERPLYRGKLLQYVEDKLLRAIELAGALPLPIPMLEGEGTAAVVEMLDGLVLSGGADVSPTSYGEVALDPRWGGDAVRDAYEIRLLQAALERGLPVLGVCRGIQLVNAGLGGTLYQDIATQVAASLVHRDWHRYDELEHAVRILPDTWVSSCHGTADLVVNSVHHQGLKQLAPGLRATAWAPDGVIEAVEQVSTDRFVIGVQWHPEWLDGSSGGPDRVSGAPLFAAFVQACHERAPKR